MGSGDKRKTNDKSRVNPPMQAAADNTATISTEVNGPGGGSRTTQDINNLCPVAFKVKVDVDLPVGTELVLEGNHLYTADGRGAGRISTNNLKRLTACAARGITYEASVVTDKRGNRYAEFAQQ
ncbi:MAG: hypothetical protein WA030_02900 [Candidatus Microsaccharimonas sp.]